MRTGQAAIISVIIALGMAGAALSGPAIAVATGQAPIVHVQAGSSAASPQTLYHA
jgi:hypothetical protein